jgi:hypothetical protein
MWSLKLNEMSQGYFNTAEEAKIHAVKMFGNVNFSHPSDTLLTAIVPSRGNVTVTIEFEED